tara:strand:+ start:2205 stop:3068 length:864 start_codon:yes stop_codon:yes gene_type:complete
MEIIESLRLKKVRFYFKLIRWNNMLIGSAAVFVTGFLLNSNNYYLLTICSLETMLIMALGNLTNDIVDQKADKINHPNRVLVNNFLSLKEVRFFQKTLILLIAIISFQMNYLCIILIYSFILPLLFLYNYYFKNIILIGNMVTAFLLGFVFVFSEIALTKHVSISLIPFVLAFNLSIIREVIKDLQDYPGDFKHNIKTLAVLFGRQKTSKYLAIYIMHCLVLFILPYVYGFYGKLYLISLIFCIEIPLIYSVFLLLKLKTRPNFMHLSFLYKILSVLGLVVILLSKG